VKFATKIYVLHVFQKKSKRGIALFFVAAATAPEPAGTSTQATFSISPVRVIFDSTHSDVRSR
jgi:hypothetical protein